MLNRDNIILTKLFLNLDFRNSGDSGFKKLIGLIISYLFVNTMISVNSFQRYDMNVFMFMALTINLFLIGFLVISDYPNLFFANKYSGFIQSLPVSEENIFVSKTLSAFAYLSVYPFVISLPPSVFIYFYNHNVADSLLFVFISFLFSYFIISLVFFLNSLVVIKSKGKSKILIFVFQIVFVSFVFMINKYSGKNSGRIDFLTLDYVKYFPQYYLVLVFKNGIYILPYIAITFLLLFFNFKYFKNNYYYLSEIINSSKVVNEKKKRFFAFNLSFVEKLILRNNTERASFHLTKNLFQANSILKLRLIPVLLLPLIATAIAVFSDDKDMLIISGLNKLSDFEVYVLNPSITITLIMAARLVYSNTKISFEGDENVQSMYSLLPISGKFNLLNGVSKFVNLYLILPVSLLTLGLVLFRIQSVDVFVNYLYLFAFVSLANTLFMRYDNVYPFSVHSTKFNNSTKYFQLLWAVLLGVVLIASQIFLFKNIIFIITAIFVILAVKVLLNKIYS